MERLRSQAARNMKERDDILRTQQKKHEAEICQFENNIASFSENIGKMRAKLVSIYAFSHIELVLNTFLSQEAANRAVKDAETRLVDAYDQLKQLPQSFEVSSILSSVQALF